tara:strand:+ start:413 stop:1180 length:768 start_codon:yes stop_codon:yes gene_type:complete
MKKFWDFLVNGTKAIFELVGDGVALVVEETAYAIGMDKTANKIKAWREEDNSAALVAGVIVGAVVVLSVGAVLGGGGAFAAFGSAASTAGSAAVSAGSWAWGGVQGAASWAAPAFGTGGFFSTPGGGALLATGAQMAGAYFGAEAEKSAVEAAQAEADKSKAEEAAQAEANATANAGVLAGGGGGSSLGYRPPEGYKPPGATQVKGLMSRASDSQEQKQSSSDYRQSDQRSNYRPTDSNGKDNYYDYSTNAWSQR